MGIRQGRVFSYDEALALFPAVRELTAASVRELAALGGDSAGDEAAEAGDAELEGPRRQVVERWTREIEALGCEVKGLWLVDWDAGDGYFCWRHPEPALAHYHGYEEGFAGRVPIA